jgi:hypothetical protein
MTLQLITDTRQELAHRAAHGLDVSLWWSPADRRVTVSVVDERCGDAFELDVGDASAMDVFHHPYAYAAARGVPYRAAERDHELQLAA